MQDKILIIGGDNRCEYLKSYFENKGKLCCHIQRQKDLFLLEKADEYGVIVLPVPVSRDSKYFFSAYDLKLKITDVAEKINIHHKVFCGAAGDEIKALFKEKTTFVCDFMNDEAFSYYNACLTAQGALRLLLENTQEYIKGKRCLVIGYGKVGETLCDVLSAQGCDVYVAARKPLALIRAQNRGCTAFKISFIPRCIYLFDYIFGTVPANILGEDTVSHIGDKALYFELASPPFTAEKRHFDKYAKTYIPAPALPGRFTAEAAAKGIGDFILENI